jgi:hypothetical protein
MRYADTNGVLSERRIVCRSIEGYGTAEQSVPIAVNERQTAGSGHRSHSGIGLP